MKSNLVNQTCELLKFALAPDQTIAHIWSNDFKVTEVQKLRKWFISMSVLSTNRHVIKRLMMNRDTARQYRDFNRTHFLLFILVRRHVTFKLRRVFHLWQTNSVFCEELTDSHVHCRMICVIQLFTQNIFGMT